MVSSKLILQGLIVAAKWPIYHDENKFHFNEMMMMMMMTRPTLLSCILIVLAH